MSGLTIKLLAQLRYASRDVDANGDQTRVHHESSSPRRDPTQDPVTVNFGKIAAMPVGPRKRGRHDMTIFLYETNI